MGEAEASARANERAGNEGCSPQRHPHALTASAAGSRDAIKIYERVEQ